MVGGGAGIDVGIVAAGVAGFGTGSTDADWVTSDCVGASAHSFRNVATPVRIATIDAMTPTAVASTVRRPSLVSAITVG